MKKFLDFTHNQTILKNGIDPLFVPLGFCHKQSQSVKKLLEKLRFGFKAQKYPYIYRFASHEEAQLALYMSLFFRQVSESGKNHYLFEASAAKEILEFARLAKKFQIIAQLVGLDLSGQLSLKHLEERLGPKSLIFSQRLLHPVLGTLNDQDQLISSLLKDNGVFYHLDITGALGELFYDLDRFEADFISFDLKTVSSLLEGGVLFSKIELHDLIRASQEMSPVFLEALITALEQLHEVSSAQMLKKITVKMELVQALKKALPTLDTVIKPPLEGLSQLVLHLPKVHAEALVFMLLEKRICLDLGGGQEQSLKGLLELMSKEASYALSCFALSLNPDLTTENMEEFVKELAQAYHSLLKGAL